MKTKVWIATLDTGGISHSGREYVAVADTREAVEAAVFAAWRKGRSKDDRSPYGEEIATPRQLVEFYGVGIYECPLGAGVEVTFG